MKKNLLTLTMFTFICFIGKAQVGINQDNPKADLDISAAATPTYAEGLLLPKVSIDDLNGMNNRYTEKQNGILVNVDMAPRDPITDPKLSTDKINKKGFYYYNAKTKMWEGFNANLGNGSFTPTLNEIILDDAVSVINWSQIVSQNPTINYFEFSIPAGSPPVNAQKNMPNPSLFKNKTIYFRNNTGQNVRLELKEEDFPKETDPNTGEQIPNIGFGNHEQTFNIYGTGAYQLYSDGIKWYPMNFNGGY